MRYLGASVVAGFGPRAAVAAITDALVGGFDPAGDPARIPIDLARGHLLLMPSQNAAAAGVKIASVAPENASLGLPRIQAVYLLFDQRTLTLQAAFDGTALTTLRTPAVSVAAVLPLLPERQLKVAVVGSGPQAVGHVDALAAFRQLADVTYLVRDPSRTRLSAVPLGSAAADAALSDADVVVCATSARTPLFDSAVLADDAIVIAIGSHEADARELDAALLARSTVVVEDTATALREAGDVVMAMDEHALRADALVPMREIVTGAVHPPAGRPVIFKGVGMSWQDLAVAESLLATVVSDLQPDTTDSKHTN